ncbi:MAG: cytochrome b [Anaerolineales bacterium]|nr:cytochrome b [Anaerolineales bacterium]
MEKPQRYHPLLVGLHWLSAFLIIFMLLVGTFVLAAMPNNQAKVLSLGLHMVTGLLILALTSVRLIVRNIKPRPAPATTGSRFLDWVGRLTHGLLYLGAFAMGLSGLGIASQANLFPAVFGGTGELPRSFYLYAPRISHEYLSWALLAIIGLHVGAALYHQFIRKDNLLGRMWFAGKGRD